MWGLGVCVCWDLGIWGQSPIVHFKPYQSEKGRCGVSPYSGLFVRVNVEILDSMGFISARGLTP